MWCNIGDLIYMYMCFRTRNICMLFETFLWAAKCIGPCTIFPGRVPSGNIAFWAQEIFSIFLLSIFLFVSTTYTTPLPTSTRARQETSDAGLSIHTFVEVAHVLLTVHETHTCGDGIFLEGGGYGGIRVSVILIFPHLRKY